MAEYSIRKQTEYILQLHFPEYDGDEQDAIVAYIPPDDEDRILRDDLPDPAQDAIDDKASDIAQRILVSTEAE